MATLSLNLLFTHTSLGGKGGGDFHRPANLACSKTMTLGCLVAIIAWCCLHNLCIHGLVSWTCSPLQQ